MARNNKKQLKHQNTVKKPFSFAQNAEQFLQIEISLMTTITALCTERTPFEDMDNLLQQLNVLRIRNSQEEQHRIAAQLWTTYEEIVKILPSGTQLDLDAFLSAFTESIHAITTERSLAENALSASAYLAECIGFSFASICPRLNQMIIDVDSKNIPDRIRWKALRRINDTLSVSSLLYEYFPQFAATLIGCLRTGKIELIENNRDLFELVASILRTSTSLIKSLALLTDFQRYVCLAAFSPNTDICIIKMLNSLLENNHEAIPMPIQAARTIYWRDYSHRDPEFREEIIKGRNLCQIIVRPRRIPCCGDLKITAPSTSTFDNSKIGNMEPERMITAIANNGSDTDLRAMGGTEGQYGNKPTGSTRSLKTPKQTTIRKKGTFLNYVERRKLQQSKLTQNDENSESDSIVALEDDEEVESDKGQIGTSNSAIEADKNESEHRKNCDDDEEGTTAGNDFAEMTTEEIFKDFIVD